MLFIIFILSVLGREFMYCLCNMHMFDTNDLIIIIIKAFEINDKIF